MSWKKYQFQLFGGWTKSASILLVQNIKSLTCTEWTNPLNMTFFNGSHWFSVIYATFKIRRFFSVVSAFGEFFSVIFKRQLLTQVQLKTNYITKKNHSGFSVAIIFRPCKSFLFCAENCAKFHFPPGTQSSMHLDSSKWSN